MKLVGILYLLILIFDLIIVCGMGEEFTLFLIFSFIYQQIQLFVKLIKCSIKYFERDKRRTINIFARINIKLILILKVFLKHNISD